MRGGLRCKMLKYLKFIFVGLFVSHQVNAEIMTMFTMQEVHTKFVEVSTKSNPEDILGIFDIDLVLIKPSNPAWQIPNIQKYRSHLKALTKNLTPEQKDILLNLITKNSPAMLVEQDTPHILQAIKERQIKIMALTASLTGRLGKIKDVAIWRYETLRSRGINFCSSFKPIEKISFKKLPAYLGRYPEFYNGILCSNGEGSKINKGEILIIFLHEVSYEPKQIIFVDDKIENLENVEKALAKLDKSIHFVGIHYKGAEALKPIPIDEKKFLHEWEILISQAKKIADAS